MRNRETKKHKREVKRRYDRFRIRAKTILVNKHKKEYRKILKRLRRTKKNAVR